VGRSSLPWQRLLSSQPSSCSPGNQRVRRGVLFASSVSAGQTVTVVDLRPLLSSWTLRCSQSPTSPEEGKRAYN
jgi:hypothetical protein